jgi:hypothetical protein
VKVALVWWGHFSGSDVPQAEEVDGGRRKQACCNEQESRSILPC